MQLVDEMTVTLRLQPRITAGRAHIEGVVMADGEETSFSGWMALLGVLEALVDERVLASSAGGASLACGFGSQRP